MATIPLNWDNSIVNASANATGQEGQKRIKAVGGAYDTTGFTPANPMAKTVNSADVTVTANRVYEFKVVGLCTVGGPTDNNNGVQEGIVFECIVPSFTPGSTTMQVVVDLTNLDITKARIILKKQSDDTIVGTQTVNKIANAATANFTGLTASTGYYVTIELYATVGGVEVVSSDVAYLGVVCGGNVAGYQTATSASPTCPAPQDLVVGTAP